MAEVQLPANNHKVYNFGIEQMDKSNKLSKYTNTLGQHLVTALEKMITFFLKPAQILTCQSFPWSLFLFPQLSTPFFCLFFRPCSTTKYIAAATAKSLQSRPTLCDPIDGSPPGSPVPGILQARALEWVAISFSNPWKWKVKVKLLCRARLLATPWTAAYQAPPSHGIFQARVLEWVAIAFSVIYTYIHVI